MHSDCNVPKDGALEKTGSNVNTWAWTCQAYSNKDYVLEKESAFTLSWKFGCGMNKQYANIGLINSGTGDWPVQKNIDRNVLQIAIVIMHTTKVSILDLIVDRKVCAFWKNKKEMQIRKGSYTSNDLFKLVVDGNSIKWYQNNNLLHSETNSLGEKYQVRFGS